MYVAFSIELFRFLLCPERVAIFIPSAQLFSVNQNSKT